MADAPKIVSHVVTNITRGPKVLNSIPPGVLVAGDSTDEPVNMTEAEYEQAKATGWFEFGEGGLSSNTVKELKALAEAEGIDLVDASNKADIIAAIELAREG